MNVVSYRTQRDGSVIRQINPSSTNDLAKADFHDTMKRSITDSNIIKVVCKLEDDNGVQYQRDEWEEKPTEPEPETTGE